MTSELEATEVPIDTGPLKWSRPRMSRAHLAANIIIPACIGCIAGMFYIWGGAL
jgi:hypothetical protein